MVGGKGYVKSQFYIHYLHLSYHVTYVHEGWKQFACHICDVKLTRENELII